MPLQYKINTHFARILKEHESNLKAKNYTERMINSFSNPNTFMNELLQKLRVVVDKNFLEKIEVDFKVTMTGYFGRSRSKVNFEFNYEYDPYNIRLHLRFLNATINDSFSKQYAINSHPSRDLPMVSKVVGELSKMLDENILQKAKEQLELIKKQKRKNRKFKGK